MIGIDFGGTQIKIGEVEDARIVRSTSMPTDLSLAPEALLHAIADAIRDFEPQPTSVGVAIPGEVDERGRCWRLPNVPNFEGVEIGTLLAESLGCRVCIENDGIAAALAESLFGHGRQHTSFAILTLGTGVGGGIVLDGRPHRGRHGFAGELGHVAIDGSADAWPCACGNSGCIEAYASTRALLRYFESLGGKAGSPREIGERADAGDAAAREAFALMGTALGRGIASIQVVLDLDAVIFSGGISAAFQWIEPSIRKALKDRAFAPPLAEIPLLVSDLGSLAGVVGAAHLPQHLAD